MSRIHVTALLALSALAVPATTGFAQVFSGVPNQADRSIQGGVTEEDVPVCQGTAGGSRMRENCDETAPTTVRTEQAPNVISIAVPALSNAECSATTTTEYYQQSAIARINTTLAVADCTAASGTFTVALRVRNESGEDSPLEFSETWQRSDDQDVKFTADYPIGEAMELRSARIRALSCTCADPAQED